jgi:TPR repeat protein
VKDYLHARELFDQLYDGRYPQIASCLGYIHAQTGSSEYNPDLAIAYYKAAAQKGDAYSSHYLAGMLFENGEVDEAINWYTVASNLGLATCSYFLYAVFRDRGNMEEANRFFDRAVQQGHPRGIQQLALRYMTGRCGLKRIPEGFRMYFQNLPNFVRYANELFENSQKPKQIPKR